MTVKAKRWWIAAAVIGGVVALLVVWPVLFSVLVPLLLSGFLAYLLCPLLKRFERRMTPNQAIWMVVGTVATGLLVVGCVIIPLLVREISDLVSRLPGWIADGQAWLGRLEQSMRASGVMPLIQTPMDALQQEVNASAGRMAGSLARGASSAAGALTVLFPVPVLVFYLLRDRHRIRQLLLRLTPQKARGPLLRICRDIHATLWQYIGGQLLMSLLTGTITAIGLMLINVPYALVLGVLMSFLDLIPYFGPFIAYIPIGLAGLCVSPTRALMGLGVTMVVQQLEGSVLSPRIIGNRVGIHPVAVILILIVGEQLGGILGMVLAMPSFLALRAVIRPVYAELLRRREMALQTPLQ